MPLSVLSVGSIVTPINIWMILGFLFAAFAAVFNDSLQTLGTFITSNKTYIPKSYQMLFINGVTIIVLFGGWFLNNGDPAWGRLQSFSLPETFTWPYLFPPILVLALTAWGAPLSTSLIVLSCFVPDNTGRLIGSSISAYLISFCLGLLAWVLGLWLLEKWVLHSDQDLKDSSRTWLFFQWFSTGFLWTMWLIQDMSNVFVYLPRSINLVTLTVCTLLISIGLCILIVIGGGPIQGVLLSKTNISDLRSVTVIDFMFGASLLFRALISGFPLSTTWAFLGLLAGRELALRIRHFQCETGSPPQTYRCILWELTNDLGKACVGLTVSVVAASAIQPLILWSQAVSR